MRFSGLIFALLAAVTFAQDRLNYINVPNGGFNVVAGEPFTITWQNPGEGDVNIRLTQGEIIEPGAGIDLTTVPASAETATFTIPSDINNGQWNFAIVEASDPSVINFSSGFQIAGASEVQTSSAPSAASSASASMSSSESAAASSASASASESASASSASASSASESSSSSASRTSASSTATTQAPSTYTNGAAYAQAGGMIAIMAGAIAVF